MTGEISTEPDEQDQRDERDAYRAMGLALRVGELLLGSGEATETVSETMRRIAATYGVRKCEADVNLSSLSISHVPGGDRAPVTAERRVRRRQPDYDRLIAVSSLVRRINAGELPLPEAETRLRDITRRVGVYPNWLIVTSLALIAASASILVGGGWVVAVAAFAATVLGDRVGAWLARRGVAEFFQLLVASLLGTLVAVGLIWQKVPVQASAVVVGAVVALLPGRALVACVQDGIAGEYVTAAGRLTEVLFIVAGVVSGIGTAIAVGLRLGVPVTVDDVPVAPLSLEAPQLLGAAAVSLTFAVALLVPPRHVLPGALGGGLIWTAYVLLSEADFPPLIATAVACAAIGLLGTAYAKLVKVPAMVFIVPAVGPLLPGTLLYRGMLDVSLGHLAGGTVNLVQAISTALAIGAGVILGAEIIRAFSSRRLARRFRPAARRTRGF
ncbi:Uncharacterized membrane protein YjjP, DUF1212 family [Sinosporangium album]|uniref:Uncharacterized membrane protein YjjP, DUF1212 family n=1 Tax=Sinosporangium album TaxID=504805 RepID=A0A1G7R5K5_9ACTN|nr:threonine/serine exporter family protein [Sinosporangium album]SDG06081.1 Uncharacterized membrane protein YjjP, DUF1212 family [Sinosporangium album]